MHLCAKPLIKAEPAAEGRKCRGEVLAGESEVHLYAQTKKTRMVV